MKLKIKLHGTLRQQFTDYQPSQGIEVDIHQGATVKELLEELQIEGNRKPVVIVNGLVLKEDDLLDNESSINVFQSIQGG